MIPQHRKVPKYLVLAPFLFTFVCMTCGLLKREMEVSRQRGEEPVGNSWLTVFHEYRRLMSKVLVCQHIMNLC